MDKIKTKCRAECFMHSVVIFMGEMTGEIVAAIIELLKVRTIITLALVGGTIWGFINNMISSDVFVGLLATVITYYFARKDNDAEGQKTNAR